MMKYDHHCPVSERSARRTAADVCTVYVCGGLERARDADLHTGINQCVGIYNERHFVLFMCVAPDSTSRALKTALQGLPCTCNLVLCYCRLLSGMGCSWLLAPGVLAHQCTGRSLTCYGAQWPHTSPAVAFILSYILCLAIGLAVAIMFVWALWGVAVGETSVESQDFEYYRRVAKERGEVFVNAYHLGCVVFLLSPEVGMLSGGRQAALESRAVLQRRRAGPVRVVDAAAAAARAAVHGRALVGTFARRARRHWFPPRRRRAHGRRTRGH